ncbi:hypothetical protein AYL99_05432 [Fonsecaea erecta]|uniref:DUF7924 domain-containing protein n=1 Tax=Fonsecaea erecta TaxID=1367422 RepID=A0A178ZKV7_9EURO|nr:hypothetical protein AYL99_05432 [Fonsecaea erecta]OAP60430.1 hypothetical protein AYL99_05432 [Fonsecaea erecta]
MSAKQGDLDIGTPTDPSNDRHRSQSNSSMNLVAGKRRRCEFEDSVSRPEPSTKRRLLDRSPPLLPVHASPSTSQIAVAEQLPSPKVTNSSKGDQQLSEFHSNPPLSQSPPTELRGVANPTSEEPCTFLESETQDWQIRRWVLATEGSEENDPQPPPIEPYPEELGGMPSAKRKSSQESLGPTSSYGEDPESIASTDARSNFYSSPAFPTLIAQHGIYMDDSPSGLEKEELEFCQELLSTSAPHPVDTMLDDAFFLSFSKLTRNKSEQWLVKHMHSHLFPSPELLALRGHDEFKGLGLIEGCGDNWLRAIFPAYGKCPQPDCTIAFKWENFSREELRKLGITIGLPSKYLARDDMFFPFITCEAKCDSQVVGLADRQNVYSMSVALEGVVDLFRRTNRLQELNGKALGLSISYDNDTVKMYAHYVVTNAQKPSGQPSQQPAKMTTMKYWTRIGQVFLSNDGGKDRWKPYDFFYNACLKFSPRHLKRIKEAIALLRDPAEASSQSVPSVDEDGQDLQVGQDVKVGEGVFKKPRNDGINGELRKQIAGLEKQLAASDAHQDEARSRESALHDQLAYLRDEARTRESALHDQLEKLRDEARIRESALHDQLEKLRDEARIRESALRDEARSRESALQAQLGRVLQLLETRSN